MFESFAPESCCVKSIVGRSRIYAALVCIVLLFLTSHLALAQRISGTLRGQVSDPTGNVVAGANVTAINQESGVSQSTVTNSAGTYIYPDLLPGTYTVKVASQGFSESVSRDVHVVTNVDTDRNVALQVGGASETIEVTTAADTVDLTSSTISSTFNSKEVIDLPSGSASPLQLSIFSANTTAQQGGVLGSGGSVAGQRPRMNSFSIDGIDDNDTGVTGNRSNVIQDAVAEFNLVTNPFSAEYGHSGAGQFNIITKSGTNRWHGSVEDYLQNRNLNALDNLTKAALQPGGALDHIPRLDVNRVGGTLGGPILKNRWFFFGAYEYYNQRQDGVSGQAVLPTADGLNTLKSLAANPQIVQLLSALPPAGSANAGTLSVTDGAGNPVAVPLGTTSVFSPAPFKEHDAQFTSDYKWGQHQIGGRFLFNHQAYITTAPLPTANFNQSSTFLNYKISVVDTWSITNSLVNDLRVGFSHGLGSTTTPAQYAAYPVIQLADLQSLQFGANDPQRNLQDTYQILDNQTKLFGRHTLKYGAEFRHYIAPSFFLSRSTGNYFYSSTDLFIHDGVPDQQALRGSGEPTFKSTQSAVYAFVQDDFKVNSRFTLNLGLRYEFTNNPVSANTQSLNAVSSVPGVIEFREPATAKLDFEPRVGFAWDPTGNGKTSIRGGFGIGYTPAPNNFAELSYPPQLQTELNIPSTCNGLTTPPAWCVTGKDFFSNGALPATYTLAPGAAQARALTQGIIPDTVDARTVNWSLGIQHELYPGGILDVRYVGSRGFHLPTQIRLNSQTAFDAGIAPLPTYFNASQVPAAIPNPASTQMDFVNFNPQPLSQYGFFGSVTDIAAAASSVYHGASASFTQTLRRGLTMRANYTWSHAIDNATNELNSSALNPRRAQDWTNLKDERSDSALDVRHKFAATWTYDTPAVSGTNPILRAILNTYQLNGSFIAQTGQPVTILSPYDPNANGDPAGDRSILNPNGVGNTGSDVYAVCNNGVGGATSIDSNPSASSCSANPANVVGYLAIDPHARYVAAQFGAKSNLPKNSFLSPGFGVWNMSLGRNFHVAEGKTFLVRVEADNVFNHRNFTVAGPVSVFSVLTDFNAFSAGYAIPGSPQFLDPKQFSGGARSLVLVGKFVF